MTTMRGYTYAPRTEGHPLQRAVPGELVANAERGPPWLVVDHALATVIVTSWPGRLLAVEVTDAVTAADLERVRQTGLRPDAGYTRAIAVRVLEELEAWRLFGVHGASVVEIIEAAQRLTVETAGALAAAVDPGAARMYAAAWDVWLTEEQRADSIHFGTDHAGTLAIPARNRAGSPIYQGFSLIAGELRRRAIAVTDGAAVEVDEEGEASLVPPWPGACDALLYAGMALGAPHLVPADARPRLLRAWDDARP
ncbi:MAG: hypothetical protein SFX73_26320 [Kofleriaceae bacterium]|nr:hypothetical protein [Kofleriaceae bacterium]